MDLAENIGRHQVLRRKSSAGVTDKQGNEEGRNGVREEISHRNASYNKNINYNDIFIDGMLDYIDEAENGLEHYDEHGQHNLEYDQQVSVM